MACLLGKAELAAGAAAPALVQAERFHADDLSWLALRSSNVSLIAGTGFCTTGQVVEYSKPTYRYRVEPDVLPPFFRVVREFAGYATAYDTTQIDGDNTVVRQSAALSDPAAGLTADGGAAIYYRPVGHGALAAGSHLRDTVLPLLRGEAVPRGSILQPKCTQVSTHSPVEVLVTDGSGRRTGTTDLADRGTRDIPDSVYDRYLDMRNITLNGAASYSVIVSGRVDGDATVRVRWLDGASVARMAIFSHVPTTRRSRGTFSIDDGIRAASSLTLDLNGDGSTILTFEPTVLEGLAAEDADPPALTITAPREGQAVVGWFPVAWSVVDAGSGPGTSGAAVDLGSSGSTLEEPGTIQVRPGPHRLDVFAEDRAGNLSVLERAFTAYPYEWLSPLRPREEPLNAGRAIPVRFVVRDPLGAPVVDDSVAVDLADVSGRSVTASLTMAPSPADGVKVQNGVYHGNLRTDGLVPGEYVLRARFSSTQLAGELRLPITLR